MLWSIEGCLAIIGINYYQIAYEWVIGYVRILNVNKTAKDLEISSGIKKLSQEFDIIKIMENLRINKVMHELVLTK